MPMPERVPDTWDSNRDEVFFRIVALLLPSAVVAGASSLLVSYDADPVGSPHDAPAGTVPLRLPLQVTVGTAGRDRRAGRRATAGAG